MLDALHTLLDALPEGVVQLRDGLVLEANDAARRCLPQLEPGAPLPDCLALPGRSPAGTGTFTQNAVSYSFSFTRSEEGAVIVFRPAPQAVLTAGQLDGALRQLRQLLGEFLAELGQENQTAPAFGKSYYRAFRLMNNLDYLRQAADGPPPGPPWTWTPCAGRRWTGPGSACPWPDRPWTMRGWPAAF